MRLKKFLNYSLAVAIVFGAATVVAGCGRGDRASLQEDENYKIYKKALAAGLTDLSYEDWLIAIKGEKGEAGRVPVITVGQNGNWYVDGIDSGVKSEGQQGSSGTSAVWTVTNGIPSNSEGNEGDMHFNTATQSIYRKEDGRWVEKSVITNGQAGQDGREIEIKVNGAYIQWGYKENGVVSNWFNLIPLSQLKGNPGANIQIQKTDTHIRYSYDGYNWANLIPLSILKGAKGDAPVITIGENGNWYVNDLDTGVASVGIKGETGEDGRLIEFNVTSTHIQWRYEGETEYKNLIELSVISGESGEKAKQIEFNVTSSHIQWRYEGETEYQNLVEISSLKAEDGNDGTTVVDVITNVDKWGIEVTSTFIMSDGSEKTSSYRVVNPFSVYTADSGEDVMKLVEYKVSTVRLEKDIELTSAIVIDYEVLFDLNSYKISIPNDEVGDGVFHVIDGHLTIDGNGIVDGASQFNDYGMVVWADGGDVTINSGHFINLGTKTIENNGIIVNNNEVIYAKNGSVVEINGGTFEGANPRWTLNSHNTEKGTIIVRGGKFFKFDPSYADTEDNGQGVIVDYMEKGINYYVYYDGRYNVIEKHDDPIQEEGYKTVMVNSAEDLYSAVLNTKVSITLNEDIQLTEAVVINSTVIINLNNHKISMLHDAVGNGVFHVIAGHLTIEGDGVVDGASQFNDYGMVIWADGGDVTINSGYFTNLGTKIVENEGVIVNHNEVIYAKNGSVVEINGGTFEGAYPRWTLNSHNTDKGTIIVRGGRFFEFDPSAADTEDNGIGVLVNYIDDRYPYNILIDADYNVVEWGENVEKIDGVAVRSEKELREMIEKGESELYLVADLELTGVVVISKHVVLNLNNHRISILNDTIGEGIFHVVEGGHLVIKGDGTVNGASQLNSSGRIIWADGGNVTILGGRFTNERANSLENMDVEDNNGGIIYAEKGSIVEIKDGWYYDENSNSALNIKDGENAEIRVSGGYFINFNPSAAGPDNEINYLLEGYKTNIEVDPLYPEIIIYHIVSENKKI